MSARRVLLFNPVQARPGELEATMVGRGPLLDELVSALEADARGPSVRHWLIVAPRGSGKSHLTEVLARRMRAAEGWSVVRLPEEAYRVRSVADLLAHIVGALEGVVAPYASEADPARVEALASERIKRWRREHGPVLVILENLAELLERRFDRREQARLRSLLMGDPPFVLVATSVRMTGAVRDHGAPFYDFFQERRLGELTRQEVTELVHRRATWDHAEEILSRADEVGPRVSALYHLSGGNPRLVLALYGVLRAGVTRDIYDQLLQLLDDVTAYYQARLNDCSPQGEQVLAEMAIAEGPLVPSEIGRRCRLKTNQVTAILAQLEELRFVRPGGRPADKRARYWEVTDRLFRIWLQMREQGDARGTLRWIVEFYRGWYAGHEGELEGDAGKLIRETWTSGEWEDLARTLRHMREAFPGQTLGYSGWSIDAVDLEREPDLQRAWAQADTTGRAQLALPMGLCALKRGDAEVALTLLEKALDAGDTSATVPYLQAAIETGRTDLAIERVRTLVEQKRTDDVLASALIAGLAAVERFEDAWELVAQAPMRRLSFGIGAGLRGRPDLALRVRGNEIDEPEGTLRDVVGPRWTLARFAAGEELDMGDLEALRGWLAQRWPAHAVRDGFTRGFLAKWRDATDEELATLEALVPDEHLAHHIVLRAWRWTAATTAGRTMRPDAPTPLDPVAVEAEWRTGVPVSALARLGDNAPMFLLIYLALTAMNLLPPDLPIWSDAVRVSAAPDRETALAGLHPEVREAVQLLLAQEAANPSGLPTAG